MSDPSQPDPSRVILKIDDVVATIVLNRPEAYNAIDAAMVTALVAAMALIDRMPAVRVIVIAAAGKGFCAGGDLPYFASRGDRLRESVDALLDAAHGFLRTLHETDRLVVVSVRGAAAGAGLSLAMAGDFCIAASDAVFVPSYLQIGASPDFGGTANMVRAIGLRRTMQVYFLEQRIDVIAAERLGIVSRIVADAALDDETMHLARNLAALPSTAAISTRTLLRQAATTSFAAQLDAEKASFQACIHQPAAQAALRRFGRRDVDLEKTTP